MKVLMLVLALALVQVQALHAEPREIWLTVQPGTSVVEVLEDREAPVAAAPPYRWRTETSRPHTYRLRHSHFDPLDLSLQWNSRVERWEVPRWYRDGTSMFLQTEHQVAMYKTVKLNVRPSDATVYLVTADVDMKEARVWRLLVPDSLGRRTVNGVEYEVWCLRRDSGGRVTLPRAHRPPWLLLERPGFASRLLRLEQGQLAGPGELVPAETVALEPLWGPFSYGWFDLLAGILAATLVAFVLPVLMRRRRAAARQFALARRLAERASGEGVLGQRVVSEGGLELQVLDRIGSGASGAVFAAARVDRPEETWAVKLLTMASWKDRAFRERFRYEVDLCCRLHHPGLVKILDWGFYSQRDEEWPFMVLECIEGTELRAHMAAGPVPWRQAVEWCCQVLEALQEVHAKGIVHRDLKPENLMITGRGRVKIVDFGIALRADLETARRVGTPRYMAPEQLQTGKVTPTADLYAVGVILYEMLSGRCPYEGSDIWQLLARVSRGQPPALASEVPAELQELVTRLLDPDPEKRAAEPLVALRGLLDLDQGQARRLRGQSSAAAGPAPGMEASFKMPRLGGARLDGELELDGGPAAAG
ncbi:MAG: serine/threonine protein kinase [Armatimonadetes bacterium]|nr:serine/threonine protein kinase [Armatimonadota bacterium]